MFSVFAWMSSTTQPWYTCNLDSSWRSVFRRAVIWVSPFPPDLLILRVAVTDPLVFVIFKTLTNGTFLFSSAVTERTSMRLTKRMSYASIGLSRYNNWWTSLWVAEYRNLNTDLRSSIALAEFSPASFWGSSIITTGCTAWIKSIGARPFSESVWRRIMLSSELNAAILSIKICKCGEFANCLSFSALLLSYT